MRRFSIRSLMAVIFVSAIGLAALRDASDIGMGMLLLVALFSAGYLAHAIRNCQGTT